MDNIEFIAYPGIIGLLIGIASRQYFLYGSKSKDLFSILYKDPLFNQYATITLLSMLYSAYIGATTGMSAGLLIAFFKGNGNGPEAAFAFALLFSNLIVRVSIENLILLFKVGEKYLRS
jgi:hypothetical protein